MPALASFPQAAVPPTAGPSFRGMALGTRGQRSPEGPLGLAARLLLLLPGETEAPQPAWRSRRHVRRGGRATATAMAAQPALRIPYPCIPYPAPCPPHPP